MSALLRTSQLTTRILRTNTLSQSIVLRSLSTYPSDRKYNHSHEWAKLDGDIATIGITDHAQGALGDIVHADLPDLEPKKGEKSDNSIERGAPAATVESVKAAVDIYAPLGGEIVKVNSTLKDSPEIINSNPHEEGWIFQIKIEDSSAFDALMSSEEYEKSLDEESS